ncbi:hypothetical protein SEA_PERIWINKLE_66 [Gordonia phage Periwinkle]|nr:hypothetical protein SEA_PERIWINKLE_66 [Gordonia phage Periwinkle]
MTKRNTFAAVVAAASVGLVVTACDPQASVPTTPTITQTVTPAAAPVSNQEQADRSYFECAAPLFGLDTTYDQANVLVPDELASVVESGRDLYASFAELPGGLSVDEAADVAGLDSHDTAVLECAVSAFGGAA